MLERRPAPNEWKSNQKSANKEDFPPSKLGIVSGVCELLVISSLPHFLKGKGRSDS